MCSRRIDFLEVEVGLKSEYKNYNNDISIDISHNNSHLIIIINYYENNGSLLKLNFLFVKLKY